MTPEQLAALVADKEAGTPGPWAVLTPILWIMAGQMQVADTRGWGYLTAPVNSNPDLGGLGLSKDAAIAIQEANARRIARVPELEDAVIALTAEVATLTRHKEKALRDAGTLIEANDKLRAEVARLSTPPDDAEVAALVAVHRGKDDGTVRGGFHRATADALTRLSHALAAETAKREAMEDALRQYAYAFCEGFCDDMPTMEYTDADCERDCGGCKARATLAKHGGK